MCARKHSIVTLVRITLAVCLASVCLSCLSSSKSASKEDERFAPTIPTATDSEKAGKEAQSKASSPLIPVERDDKDVALPPSSSKRAPQAWEDEKVREVAFDLAGKLQQVAKIKICFDTKADEWWIILYEDTGSNYSLHQHIWHRDQDKLEPFLVGKTVPKNQLEASLGSSNPEMACEVLDPPTKEPLKALPKDFPTN